MQDTITTPTEAAEGQATEPIVPKTPSANGTSPEAVTELAVAGGHKARIGDPVAYRGRPGTVAQFLWREATAKRRSRWIIVVEHTDGNLPRSVQADPDAVWVRQDEVAGASWADSLAAAADGAADSLAKIPPSDDEEDRYPVPTVLSFAGRETKEAGDLRQIGTQLIEETEDFEHLKAHASAIDYVWVMKGGSKDDVPNLSNMRSVGKFERRSAQMMVVLAADTVRDLRATRRQVEALVHECLCAIAKTKRNALRKKAPDFHGYSTNVRRYGDVLPHVKAAAAVLKREPEDVRNARLFEDDPEDTEVEDSEDAGV